MKHVAAVIVLIAAVTAATLVVRGQNERIAALERARAEGGELVRHLDTIEKMLAIALDRDGSSAAHSARNATSSGNAPREPSAASAPQTHLSPEQRAAHEEALRAGNAIVDRAIAAGLWNPTDFATLGAATKDLSGEERAQIMARLSAAINADQVRFGGSGRTP